MTMLWLVEVGLVSEHTSSGTVQLRLLMYFGHSDHLVMDNEGKY